MVTIEFDSSLKKKGKTTWLIFLTFSKLIILSFVKKDLYFNLKHNKQKKNLQKYINPSRKALNNKSNFIHKSVLEYDVESYPFGKYF